MAPNADEDRSEETQDDKPVTAADLAASKANAEEVESESSDESEETTEEETSETGSEDTGEEDGQTDDQTTEEEQSDSTFTKKFQNIKGETPEEYARNLEVAYDNSFAELKRIRESQTTETESSDDKPKKPVDPVLAYAAQKMQEDITRDISEFSKEYPQMQDEAERKKVDKRIGIISKTIQEDEGRIPSMRECLDVAAAMFKWQPNSTSDKSEQIGAAVKNGAASTKTNSSKKQTPVSKVTDKQIALARQTWGVGKSDAEIRKELEVHV